MNYHERPTPLHERAYAEARQHFAEHLKQFQANCEVLHTIEGNLSATASDVVAAARESSGRIIQTDNGTEWRHGIELTQITSVCHRQTSAGLEFAVVECLRLPSGEMKNVLNSGQDVSEVLQQFVRDQRQVFKVWKDDLTAQVREHLEEKYPHQDMNIVAKSFDIRLGRDLSRREIMTQNHSRGVRI
jgi:hypothetical protein